MCSKILQFNTFRTDDYMKALLKKQQHVISRHRNFRRG